MRCDLEKIKVFDFSSLNLQENSKGNCFGGCDCNCDGGSCDCNCDCDSNDCDCNNYCDNDE